MIFESSKIIVTSLHTGAVTLEKDIISYTSFTGNTFFPPLLLFEKREYCAIINGLYIFEIKLFMMRGLLLSDMKNLANIFINADF